MSILESVRFNDVIFGLGAGGQEKLLLVYKVDQDGFWARHVTTQIEFRFNRDGKTRVYDDGGYVTIVSTARLPPDMYEAALGLDRKCAARPEYPDSILSRSEIQLLLTFPEIFKTQLVPGTEPTVRGADKLNGVRAILQLEWDPLNATDNPPGWNEYLDYLPALVELLDGQASVGEVTGFLADIAARRKRAAQVSERNETAAASLVRLRESWI